MWVWQFSRRGTRLRTGLRAGLCACRYSLLRAGGTDDVAAGVGRIGHVQLSDCSSRQRKKSAMAPRE